MSVVAQATALLRQLDPADLSGDDAAELRTEGLRLFGRLAIQQRYGEKDVVEFLSMQAGHRRLRYRLEKLQKQIREDHERRCRDRRALCRATSALTASAYDGHEPARNMQT